MKLTLLTGRPGSGCRERVYAEAAEALNCGETALILVPEQFTLEGESMLIDAMGSRGFLGQPIMSPTRLTQEVFDRMDKARPETMDERGRAMAVRRAASSLEEGSLLGRSLRSPRFAAEVSELLGDMKRFDVTPEALEAAGLKGNGLLRRKTHDVAMLYRAYNAFLESRGQWDSEARLNALIEALPEAGWLRKASVWVDGFDQYPPQWRRLIKALCRCTAEVTVTLTAAEDGASDAAIFATGAADVLALTAMAEEAGIPCEHIHLEKAADTDVEILTRRLYAYERMEPVEAEHVHLREAPDVESEIEDAAALVGKLARSGMRYRHIRLACTDLAGMSSRIARIFARSGIPTFTDDRYALLEHPLPGLILAALETVGRGWHREDVLRCAKNPIMPLASEETEALEMMMTAYDMRGARRILRPFRYHVEGIDTDAAERARAVTVSALKALPARAKPAAWKAALETLAERWSLQDGLDAYYHLCESKNELAEASRTAQVWEETAALLRQVVLMLPEEEMTAIELEQLLEAGFGAARVGILPTRGDAVLVGDIGRTKANDTEALIVLGAQEGQLPLPHGEGAIFHDRDLAVLNDADLCLGRDGTVRTAQSKLAVVDALTSADEVWFLYARTNEAGDELRPSPVVLKAREITGAEPERTTPWESRSVRSLVSAAAREMGRIALGRNESGMLKPALATLAATREGAGRLELLKPTAAEEPVGEQSLDSLTVSKLEEYGKCPLAWFAQYRLAPQEWPRMVADARNIGSFTHEVMEKMVNTEGALASEDAAEETAMRLCEELKEEYFADAEGDSAMGDYLFRQMREVCRRTARAAARQTLAGSFVPIATEQHLQDEAVITLEDGSLMRLSGIIDRVDSTGGEAPWIRVVDYKTGPKAMNLGGVADGTQLQLWIYLKTLLDQGLGKPAGVYYSPAWDKITPNDPRMSERLLGVTVDDEAVIAATDAALEPGAESEVIAAKRNKNGSLSGSAALPEEYMTGFCTLAEQTAARLGAAMKRGEVDARPVGKICEFCTFATLCRKGSMPPKPGVKYSGKEAKTMVNNLLYPDDEEGETDAELD